MREKPRDASVIVVGGQPTWSGAERKGNNSLTVVFRRAERVESASYMLLVLSLDWPLGQDVYLCANRVFLSLGRYACLVAKPQNSGGRGELLCLHFHSSFENGAWLLKLRYLLEGPYLIGARMQKVRKANGVFILDSGFAYRKRAS